MKTISLRITDAGHMALHLDALNGLSINDLVCKALTTRYTIDFTPEKHPKYFHVCKGRPVKREDGK